MAYTSDDRLITASQAFDGVLTVGTFTSLTSAVIREANPQRTMLTVFNQGPGVLYVLYGSGTVSTSNYSVKLFKNNVLELPFYQGIVAGIFDSEGIAKITEL
jgi:CRISPR/Cas system-associated endonuclease Cas1